MYLLYVRVHMEAWRPQPCDYVFVCSCTYVILCSCLSLPLSLSVFQCVSTCSIYQLLPHTEAGVGWGGGLSAVAALVPVARRESAPWPPPQPIVVMQEAPGPMRRLSEAVGRRSGSSWSFFDWFLNGVVMCWTSKQVSGVIFSPLLFVSVAVASGSLSQAVDGDSSSQWSS